MYGGDGGLSECRYELILWTKVDFPAPAIPMVIMTIGFFLIVELSEPDGASIVARKPILRVEGRRVG